jgi:type IV pilus assembly protein PilQ
VDLDFQDAYSWDVLRRFADISRLNVVVHPGVKNGRVIYHAKKVPWDQAFDLVIRTNGLTWTRTGDVIRVEPPRRAPSH